jgi:hypothetical protein
MGESKRALLPALIDDFAEKIKIHNLALPLHPGSCADDAPRIAGIG